MWTVISSRATLQGFLQVLQKQFQEEVVRSVGGLHMASSEPANRPLAVDEATRKAAVRRR